MFIPCLFIYDNNISLQIARVRQNVPAAIVVFDVRSIVSGFDLCDVIRTKTY